MKILVLFTCYNRCEKTLTCINSLQKNTQIKFDFIVVDDNSQDDTCKELKKYNNITVLHGNGSLFYSGGMRMAIAEAKSRDLSEYSYVMFVNDDVEFFENSISKLVEYLNGENSIEIGSMCDSQGKLSYGGVKHVGSINPRYQTVMSKAERTYCDTFCANCVLLPKNIFVKLPNIDSHYKHAMGDFDYGWEARRQGVKILASNDFVGRCNDNPKDDTWSDPALSIKERLRKKETIKGLPRKEYFYFLKKNHGLLTAVIYSATPYLKILLKK